jgi:hypothetical protein
VSFKYPPGIQNRTRHLISQILWTIWLDFGGTIEARDAPGELLKALRARQIDIPNEMTFRMMLPHMDGGKYGKYIRRVVSRGRSTTKIELVCDLPDESYLRDQEQIAPDVAGDTVHIARDDARDKESGSAPPAQGPCDVELRPGLEGIEDNIARLQADAAELFEPIDLAGEPASLIVTIGDLFDTLKDQLAAFPAGAQTGAERDAWLREKAQLVDQLETLRRRVRDAEARLIERGKEVEGLKLQLTRAAAQYEQASRNIDALQKGERVNGHFRTAERFITEKPHDRRGRTTGSDSELIYSAG